MKDKYIHTQVDEQWANCRNTSREVASAIHAVAGPNDMDRVWEAPYGQFDDVVKALEQFISNGDVAWDHTFHWGEVSITPVVDTFKDYPNAQAYHDFLGGWLLIETDGYWVCDDPGIVKDLRGEDWMDECVRQQCWDETLLKEAA
jgi:hypothetical protein